MSPKSKIVLLVLFVSLTGVQMNLHAQEKNALITFYQEHISAIDGDRCPMYPSCSAYAITAFEKHGAIIGWVMTCDRLMRCGRDETKTASQVFVHAQTYSYDPVDANDGWWFKKTDND